MAKRTFHSGTILDGKVIEVQCIPVINRNKCVIFCKIYGITVFDLKESRIIFSKQILAEGYRRFIHIAVRMWLKSPHFYPPRKN